MKSKLFFIIATLCTVLLALVGWATLRSACPYKMLSVWNQCIVRIRDAQNQETASIMAHQLVSDFSPTQMLWVKPPPSLCYAEMSPLRQVRQLHRLIASHHDDITREVEALVSAGYDGIPAIDIDSTQRELGDVRWKPIWVKFVGSLAGTASRLPTLKRIVEHMGDEVLLLHVSVFSPGTRLPVHRGITMGVLRYHYGLRIPDGDTGMTIGGCPFTWQNRRGYTFDDTILHDSRNLSASPRWVILADLPRDLGMYTPINKMIHSALQRTKHIKQITSRLAKEGILVD